MVIAKAMHLALGRRVLLSAENGVDVGWTGLATSQASPHYPRGFKTLKRRLADKSGDLEKFFGR